MRKEREVEQAGLAEGESGGRTGEVRRDGEVAELAEGFFEVGEVGFAVVLGEERLDGREVGAADARGLDDAVGELAGEECGHRVLMRAPL